MIIPLNNLPAPSQVPTLGDIRSGNSMLFLFSPRQIIDHYKRPITYNFTNAIIESIAENIIEQPSLNSVNKVLNMSRDMSQAIVPLSIGGINISTSTYSNNWMFVLIIDGDTKRNLMLSNKLANRSIFMGVCNGDPMSRSGLSSATPEQFLNPNCQLIITRSLELSKYTTQGANGVIPKIKTINDINIAQFDDRVWKDPNSPIVGESYYALTPADINASTTNSSDGSLFSIVDSGDSLNNKGKISIESSAESPRRHMKDILTIFETGAAKNMHNNLVSEFGDDIGALGANSENLQLYINSAFEEKSYNNKTPYHDETNVILGASYLTIGMVMTTYSPKVNIINTPASTPADIIPQNATSINTVFSSLVCAVIPSYLNAVGLSAISFMYNSAAEASKLFHIESTLNLTNAELQQRYLSFEYLIKTDLYPILYGNGGHFDLQVMSSINSTTDVVLNFLDFTLLPMGAIYQENTVLGGIVSPLIGTKDHLVQNSIQLSNLVSNVVGRSNHTHY
jgi:hypothetical protein